MANPFERCPSTWQGTDKNRTQVRCDRWAGHAGQHRGFDDQDMAYRWSDEHVPWNQPVPDNLEVDEDMRLGDPTYQDRESLLAGWQQLVRQRDGLLREKRKVEVQRDEALSERDEARKEQEGVLEGLQRALDALHTVHKISGGPIGQHPSSLADA